MADPGNQPITKIVISKEELAQEKLTAAYREVLGEDGKRNTSQQKVWEDLLAKTFARTSIHFPGKDGSVDVSDGLIRSGRRDIYLHLEAMLHFELESQEQKQNKRR